MAWLSADAGSPSTRFTKSTTPYVRTDGVVVATSYADLIDGALLASIAFTETNQAPTSDTVCIADGVVSVWTNTKADGTTATSGSCGNWSSDIGDTVFGAIETDTQWSFACDTGGTTAPRNFCGKHAPLYCFEQ